MDKAAAGSFCQTIYGGGRGKFSHNKKENGFSPFSYLILNVRRVDGDRTLVLFYNRTIALVGFNHAFYVRIRENESVD